MHILDIAENSLRADATRIQIDIIEDYKNDKLTLIIKDNGKGMEKDLLNQVTDPFFTTKIGKKTGLGLPLLAQATQESDGSFKIKSKPQKGMKIMATFRLSHIDRKPLGNIEETIYLLKNSHPLVEFIYNYKNIKYN